VSSCFTRVPCGVPQGSTLGPLLFLVCVNYISRVLPGENVKLFADDTNLFISGVDVNTLNQKCNYFKSVVYCKSIAYEFPGIS